MATLQSTLKLTLLDQVSARARAITGVLNNLQNQQRRMMAPFTGGLAQFMALAGAYVGVTQGIQGTIGAALSFESAFADVKKVVDASDEQLQGFERSIRKLSTIIPATANDLAKLYAAGAESGIATNELNQFAEMASRVGIAFDIPMEQAGDSLAKLKTQLGLTLTETGDLADAMNHLSNNMASKASDIQAFMLRVGALAEMGGLAKEEIAAMGSAMIAAGAEPEVAATAMQNVVKAMTRGKSAKASQKAVAKALGLNLPQLAKDMQKDAPAAIKKVLAAIAKQPKDRHISLLSDFFGDEAKAFAPLVGNIKLLDDALASVSDRSKYAGSAYKEYVARANTTANVLQILQNKFAELGRSIGDDMLPGIKEAATAIGHVIDTLGERATIFDQMQTAVQGFTNGLGLKGGIGEAIESLADLTLGVDNGTEAADKLGRIFARFQQYGQNVKQFAADVDEAVKRFEKAFNLKPGTIGDTLGEIAGWGFTLGAASIGISMAAGAVMALGRALLVLSGASLLIGGAKGLASLFGAVSGVTPAAGKVVNTAATGAKAATAVVKPGVVPTAVNLADEWAKVGKFAKIATVLQAVTGLYDAVKNSSAEGRKDSVDTAHYIADSTTRFLFGDEVANRPDMPANEEGGQAGWVKVWNDFITRNGKAVSLAVQDALKTSDKPVSGVAQQVAIQSAEFPGKAKDDVGITSVKEVLDAIAAKAGEESRRRRDFEADTAAGSYTPPVPAQSPLQASVSAVMALEQAIRARAAGMGGTTDVMPGKTKDDLDIGRPKTVTIDAASIAAMVAPSGVQQVHVVNQAVPNVSVSAPITVNGVMNPQAAASSAASQLGEKVKSAVESANTD